MAECQRCPFQAVVTALAEIVKMFPKRVRENGRNVAASLNQAELLLETSKNQKVRKAAKALVPEYSRLVGFIEGAILPVARKVCHACSTTSDDDNLSRHGRTFVFLDAQPNASNLSATPGEATQDGGDPESALNGPEDEDKTDFLEREHDAFFADDSREERESAPVGGDWLNTHAVRSPSATGGTNLPTHIEDVIRKVLHDFLQLTVFEQLMILRQMAGETFVEFGTLKWMPYELKRPQSKEFVSLRWKKLVAKFPLAAALRRQNPSAKRRDADSCDTRPAMVQDEINLFGGFL